MKKYNIDLKEIYIYLLITSAFISISVFEIFVVIGLLTVIYQWIKREFSFGILSIPIAIFSSVALISTAMFNMPQFSKAIEQGFFQLLYFFNPKNINFRRLIIGINVLFIIWGIIHLGLVIYNTGLHYNPATVSGIWGGVFEVANFFTIFSFSAFFLGVYFLLKKKYLPSLIAFALFFLFLAGLIFTHRRAYMLSFFLLFYVILFILYKSSILNKKIFAGISFAVLISLIGGYIYLSKTDPRFEQLNRIITGKVQVNEKILNNISSLRYKILKDAIHIIQTDIKNKNYINLLIGHGINSGKYLPHKYSPKNFGKYESIFLVSEFIEIGLIGLLAELMIFFLVFKFLIGLRLYFDEDVLALSLVIPLAIHLLSVIFTFFWDALLPLYLLLFKLGEVYFRDKERFKLLNEERNER